LLEIFIFLKHILFDLFQINLCFNTTNSQNFEKKLIKIFFSYGENAFAPPHIKSLWELILENFNDKINLVLCAAAFVSMVIGIINHPHDPLEGMIEGTSICMALVIIIAVNSGNNYASERRIAKLLESAEKLEVAVWRGNTAEITVDSTELVVGDLIKIENGKKIAADCLMVEGQDVECVEAELTGEPDAIKKTPIT
jgi:Ca2+-transporting ATPase